MSSTNDLNTMSNCTHYGDVLSCLCRAVLELLSDKEARDNLDHTAPKVEPEPRGSWYEEAVKQQGRAESFEARVKSLDKLTDEQNDAMKALEVKLATERNEGRIEGYRSALNDKTNGELVGIMATELARARAEGDKAGRERITTLFMKWYKDPDEGWNGEDFIAYLAKQEAK